MNNPITRDIITDLLPVYLSGEASEETKALIENFMKEDAEFARLVKTEAKVTFPNHLPDPTKEQEMKVLHETKRRLRRRSWHLGLAIFLTCFAFAFRFGPEGFTFTWEVSPATAIISGLLGLMFWILYFHKGHQLKATGL
jgi:ferric-dicitrate binding protein FerR (iron transport regulator)